MLLWSTTEKYVFPELFVKQILLRIPSNSQNKKRPQVIGVFLTNKL